MRRGLSRRLWGLGTKEGETKDEGNKKARECRGGISRRLGEREQPGPASRGLLRGSRGTLMPWHRAAGTSSEQGRRDLKMTRVHVRR